MAARCVLLLDAAGLQAYHRQGRGMALDAAFAADAEGRDAFAQFLAGHRGCLFHLLINSADEGFHMEEIPYLHGRDRKTVIRRKLDQTFYGTSLGAALPLGRSPEGRQDERVLLMALTRPQLVDPWLAIIEQTKALLADIVSLPQVLAGLNGVVRAHPRCLLMSPTRGGLRQTLLDGGLLRFSRLTPWNDDLRADAPAAYWREATKLHQYLAGQRLVARGTALPVLILILRMQWPAWREQFHDSEELRFECLDAAAVGRRVLPAPPADGDALYAQLLLQRRPRQQLAPETIRHPFRLWQIERIVNGSSLAICAACLLFAACQLPTAARRGEENADLRSRNEATARAWQEVRSAQVATPLAVDRLRSLLARYDELRQGTAGPTPLLQRLSLVMNDFPQIELEHLEWSVARRFDDATEGPFAIVDIDARLPPATANDPRRQIAAIDDFCERLRADPSLRVRVTNTSFDPASSKSLRGGGDETAAPQFSLRVAQRLPQR